MASIAVYPGTFDPTTKGHLDIIERAATLFDRVIMAASDHGKKSPMFALPKRLEMMEMAVAHLGNVEVTHFDSLLVDFAARKGARAIIRGLRASPDFDYEFQMAQYAKDQHPDIEMLYLMATRDILHISASAVRELLALGADVSAYVPPSVLPLVRKQLKKRQA